MIPKDALYGPSSTWERHGTTEAVRRATAGESRELEGATGPRRNPKTIAKWKARSRRSPICRLAEEARINHPVGRGRGRRRLPSCWSPTLLLPTIASTLCSRPSPALLTRSSPSPSLPPASWNLAAAGAWALKREASPKRKFKAYPIGFFHVDIAEVQMRARQTPSLRRDRPRLQVRGRSARRQGQYADRARLLEALPPPRLTGLRSCSPTMGIQFADPPKNRSGPTARLRGHPFDRARREHGIEHRLDRFNHLLGPMEQVEQDEPDNQGRDRQAISQTNLTDQLVRHLADFVAAYGNYAFRRLKTFTGLYPLRVRLQTMDNRA